jgi:hypothetical protein
MELEGLRLRSNLGRAFLWEDFHLHPPIKEGVRMPFRISVALLLTVFVTVICEQANAEYKCNPAEIRWK